MTAYYNEIDPFAANWLRNLIKANLIAKGEVDERSISDIRPSELVSYSQHHFFAGIGGWSIALRLAGWEDNQAVWTGSCPCQPFSTAGTGSGFADERHLWPHWFHLIREIRPSIVFGEQVEAAIKYGWLDLVQDDLEGEGYAFGAIVAPAASVGAPHIRHRIFWLAESYDQQFNRRRNIREGRGEQSSNSSVINRLADHHHHQGPQGRKPMQSCSFEQSPRESRMVGQWTNCDWLPCRDGKWRPVESGTFPLAHGIPGRVGRLRGYGNAIVPHLAAEFVKAYMACRP